MKYLKKYEEYDINDFDVGDYVIMNRQFHPGLSNTEMRELDKFLKNNIGIITNINKIHNNVKIKYHNIPFTISHIFTNNEYMFNPQFVKHFDKDVDTLKAKVSADIFNL